VDFATLRFDPPQLHEALAALPVGAWSEPSTFETTRAHEGYRQITTVAGGRIQPAGEPFRFVFDAFTPVYTSWLAWIDAGGYVVAHCDPGPCRERWHLPIHAAGWTTGVRGVEGVPFPVCQWEPHWVDNDSDRVRIHLIIDRDVIVQPDRTPFRFVNQGA
jgi:hypothetical protein